MKIFISGSMAFSKEMKKVQKDLTDAGHEVVIPYGIEDHLENPEFVDDLDNNFEYCLKTDVMRKCFDLVAACDAVLVLNLPRKGIDGYMGTSTLMEFALAYYLKKKLFLMHDVPSWNEVRWAHEIRIMQPTIIHGDLGKVK